jgi:hypothetical protein
VPSAKQAYPDFSSLADQQVARHLKLIWDHLNKLRDTPAVDLSGLIPISRKIGTIGKLLGGGTLDRDLTLRIDEARPNAILTSSVDQAFGVGPVSAALSFDTVIEDRFRMRDPSAPTHLPIPTGWAGLWSFWGYIRFEGTNLGGLRRNAQIRKNGVTYVALGQCAGGSQTEVIDVPCYGEARLAVGDYLELLMAHDSPDNLAALAGTAGVIAPVFGARWLSP